MVLGSVADWISENRKTGDMIMRSGIRQRLDLHEIYPELAQGAKVLNGPLGILKLHFAEYFAHWGISLPEEDVVNRRRGKICEAVGKSLI